MKSVLLLLVFLFFSLGFASLDTDFANSAYLDNGKNFELFWTVHKEEKTISFAAKVKTLGWLGFGISAGTGNMVGSDVVMGWVKEGKGFLQDRYAEAKALPVLDNQQDYKLDDASEEGGYTILKFTRKYDTCDAKQDNQIKAGTVRVVYAFHADDPTSDSDFSKHTHRGSRSLLLLNVHTEKPEIPNDLQHFDILHNITVPSATTSYMCKPYVFPLFSEKRQIIKVEPIVTPGNEGYVHHTVVYGCKSTFNPNLTTVTGPCYDRINMPPDITSCAGQSSLWAWAVGAGPFFYPKHVGFAIGAGHGPRYVVMEVHYDNPSNTEGVADYSGLRFHHTAQTRMYDAGMIWAGWAPFDAMIIPPQQKEWISVGYCSGECTEAGFAQSTLPDKGINIIAILLHTHLQGVKIWTRHIRDGVELLEVARDDNYDFNFQEFQVLPEEVHVKPGDDLVQVCHYQTMDKTEPVVGGLGTPEEMCMAFIVYYPKVELTKCWSVNDVRLDLGNDPSNMSWTEDQVREYKDLLQNQTTIVAQCSNDESEPLPINVIPKPKIVTPLVTDHDPCLDSVAGFSRSSSLVSSSVVHNIVLVFLIFA